MTKPPFRPSPVVRSFLAVLLAAAPPALAAQPVGFGNLSAASTVEYSNATKEGGKGIVNGSKLPHANFHFTFATGAETYNIDSAWTNAGGLSANATKGVHNLQIGKRNYLAQVAAWNTDGSVFDGVLSGSIFDETNPANWMKPGNGAGDPIQLQLKDGLTLQSEFTRAIVKHLISMRAGLFWRQNTITVLSSPVRYSRKPQAGGAETAMTAVVNWGNVIKAAREVVKDKLSRNQLPLGAGQPPSNGAVSADYDDLIAGILSSDPGFKQLMDLTLLFRPVHGGYEGKNGWFRQGTYQYKLTDVDDINQPLNHIRFMMYMEWRGMSELINAQ